MKNGFGHLGGVLLIILSSLLIFYQFNQIPKNISYDEIEFGQLALSLDNKPYTPYSPIAYGHSTLYFYIIFLSFKIFGINNFALRLPSAIFGVLGVLVFYLILETIHKKNNILNSLFLIINPLILLTSRWYLNFTRFSFEATFLLFLELVSIYSLVKAKIPVFRNRLGPFRVRRRKNTVSSFYLIISGLFAGLAFNSYTPGRIFFLLPLFFLLITRLKLYKLYNFITLRTFLLFLIPFLLTITPLTIYLIKHKDTRIQSQYFLNKKTLSLNKKISYVWSNLKSTALMFNFRGDMNGRHNFPGKPALNPILGGLFILGLLLSLINWKKSFNRLAISYWLLAITPTLFTNPQENPNMLRTFTAIPSTVYLIGFALIHFCTIVQKWFSKKLAVVVLLSTITLSSTYELYTYFKYQSRVFRNSFEIKCPIETVIQTTRTTVPKSCLVTRNEF